MSQMIKKVAGRRLLQKLAESHTHRRLTNELDSWAQDKGYLQEGSTLPNGQRPDVWRLSETKVFVGDAKVAQNEPPTNYATLVRIGRYVHQFVNLIAQEPVDGGIFAIATDEESAAEGWVTVLNELMSSYDITDGDGNGPSFQVQDLNDETWFTYW